MSPSPTPRWVFRLVYFARFTLIGSTYPMVALYIREQFGSMSAVGGMYAITSLVSLLTMPLWGYAGDMVWSKRTILLVNVAAAVSVLFVSGLVPWLGLFMMLQGLMALFAVPVDAILNSSAMNAREVRHHFSEIRAWGTLSFIITCLFTGWLADRATPWVAFPINLIGGALFWGTLWLIETPHAPPAARPSFAHVQRFFLGQRHFAWFFVALLINRMGHEPGTIYQTFVAKNLVSPEYANTAATALIVAGAAFELPVFFFGDWIVRRFGEVRCLFVCVALAALRLILVPVLPFWGLVLIQFCHAFSFGLFFLAGLMWLNRRTPAALRTSAHTMHAMVASLGAFIAMPLAGYIYDQLAPENVAYLFWGLAALVIVSTIGFVRMARLHAPVYHVGDERTDEALPTEGTS